MLQEININHFSLQLKSFLQQDFLYLAHISCIWFMVLLIQVLYTGLFVAELCGKENYFGSCSTIALVHHPNTLMQLSEGSLASEVAIRCFIGFSKVFEYLSEQTQDKHSCNKGIWNSLGASSIHVFQKCKINLVRMDSVINPKPLLPFISPANSLGSVICDGTCWRLGIAGKQIFACLLWMFLFMKFTRHSYCHSSSAFSFLEQFIHKSDIKLLVLRPSLL